MPKELSTEISNLKILFWITKGTLILPTWGSLDLFGQIIVVIPAVLPVTWPLKFYVDRIIPIQSTILQSVL
jgi:hypothetical protein